MNIGQRIVLIVGAVALAALCGCAYNHSTAGMSAMLKGNPWLGIQEWSIAAEQGDTTSQMLLALCYDRGIWNVPVSHGEAVKYFRMCAERGVARCQYELGCQYEFGTGVPQDYAEAIKWYRKAAEQGNDWAQMSIGRMYDTGEGVEKNAGEAMRWYSLAAEQGEPNAMLLLGQKHYHRFLVTGDASEVLQAHMYTNLGCSRIKENSTSGYPQMRDAKEQALDKVQEQACDKAMKMAEGKMTPSQIAEAQRLAREWKPKKQP